MKRLHVILAVLGASLGTVVAGIALAKARHRRMIVAKQVVKKSTKANARRPLLLGRFESPEQFADAAVAALRKVRARDLKQLPAERDETPS